MKTCSRSARALVCLLLFIAGCQVKSTKNLETGFLNPPAQARPWVYWFWLNGNITREGITADLEAMKRVGIGGVLIMEVDQGTPAGPIAFAGKEWRELFAFVCAEANRLGLEVNMNNDAGWCGSGGPWITPDLAMQKVVFSETKVDGAQRFDGVLPQPMATANYYRDIAILAFPTPANGFSLDMLPGKSAKLTQHFASPASWPDIPKEQILPREQVLNITDDMDSTGHLLWQVPQGKWTIIRFGHTLTGKDNHPAPLSGRGLESDKLSQEATDAMFNGLMGKLISDVKPLAGKTLVSTHIDSWETGSQNWTPKFRQEFQKRRGYDLLPFLPVMTGRVVASVSVSERFLWDVRQTVSDLLIENYAGRFRTLAHQHGVRLSIEAYDDAPCDEMTFAGQADEPMAEFWSWGNQTPYSCTEMTSAAHTYGKRIIGAEAFTATDGEKWLLHPANIKALGDWAFCEGINRFVFHRYALQPWREYAPGVSMGPWGLHYERTQTWWEQSKPWHEYLSRCQYLLQQGLFVADICYLQPEGSPRRFSPTLPGYIGNAPERARYNFDGITPEALLTRMQVKDGCLVLPDGTSYRMLVLPQMQTMTPPLLTKIKELLEAGATVLGPPPSASPSLTNFPQCDHEVQKLVAEMWGNTASESAADGHRVGKGRVIWDDDFKSSIVKAEWLSPLNGAKWIWFAEGNPADAAAIGKCYFRRSLTLNSNQHIASAKIMITADNSYTLWVNDHLVGSGANANMASKLDIKSWLKPDENLLTVEGENAHEYPNPAALIAKLVVTYSNGDSLVVLSDAQWLSTRDLKPHWRTDKNSAGWRPAMEVGPLGMKPFPVPDVWIKTPVYVYPKFEAIANVLQQMGVAADFEADSTFRYVHRRVDDMDVYFVSNRTNKWHGANCTFRVSGKAPELWNPLTGKIQPQLIYQEQNGQTMMPLWLEPSGSMFVVFRTKGNARIKSIERDGHALLPDSTPPSCELAIDKEHKTILRAWQSGQFKVQTENNSQTIDINLPAPIELAGPWQISFPVRSGVSKQLNADKLVSWSEHSDAEVRYFSGTAKYRNTFTLQDKKENVRLYLDLGRVAVMAQVTLNGKELGTLWRAPFLVDVTDVVQAGENVLEIKVTNLWVNRQIGDEFLPEDSDRNANGTLKSWPQWLLENKPSPTGRTSFTTYRLWNRNDVPVESGLLGPVRLVAVQELKLR
jgi:hypothetical protein